MAAGALTEVVTEEVATNLEEVAEGVRRIDPKSLGFLLGGVGVGLAVGFYFGYRFNREKIKAEAFRESQEEVEKIRELYAQKTLVSGEKPSVEQIIEERGYSTAVPDDEFRALKPPVPIISAPPREEPLVVYDGGKEKDRNWNYPEELSNRTLEHPYVIHQDEFSSGESGYSKTTYTYWAGDDVLTDTDNHPLPHADLVVGVDNLKWGHGTDDIDVVYVRNDRLQLEMEICRTHKSFEEEVLGHDPSEEAEEAEETTNDLEHSHTPRPAPKRRSGARKSTNPKRGK